MGPRIATIAGGRTPGPGISIVACCIAQVCIGLGSYFCITQRRGINSLAFTSLSLCIKWLPGRGSNRSERLDLHRLEAFQRVVMKFNKSI